ncbi:hypothetical protein LSAT2_009201 [Lamellibrachia satsuma]|nr:hypothetical protein LSAT2_009201 [Lamellibrachia satsuma]
MFMLSTLVTERIAHPHCMYFEKVICPEECRHHSIRKPRTMSSDGVLVDGHISYPKCQQLCFEDLMCYGYAHSSTTEKCYKDLDTFRLLPQAGIDYYQVIPRCARDCAEIMYNVLRFIPYKGEHEDDEDDDEEEYDDKAEGFIVFVLIITIMITLIVIIFVVVTKTA